MAAWGHRISGPTATGALPPKAPSCLRRDRSGRRTGTRKDPPNRVSDALHIAEPIRRIPWPIVDPNDPRSAGDARMACHERARRLRVGHGQRA